MVKFITLEQYFYIKILKFNIFFILVKMSIAIYALYTLLSSNTYINFDFYSNNVEKVGMLFISENINSIIITDDSTPSFNLTLQEPEGGIVTFCYSSDTKNISRCSYNYEYILHPITYFDYTFETCKTIVIYSLAIKPNNLPGEQVAGRYSILNYSNNFNLFTLLQTPIRSTMCNPVIQVNAIRFSVDDCINSFTPITTSVATATAGASVLAGYGQFILPDNMDGYISFMTNPPSRRIKLTGPGALDTFTLPATTSSIILMGQNKYSGSIYIYFIVPVLLD